MALQASTLLFTKLGKKVDLYRNQENAMATPRDDGGERENVSHVIHGTHGLDSRSSRASKHSAPHAPPAESAFLGFVPRAIC